MSNAKERVANGVNLLTAELGAIWYSRVDLDRLNMEDSTNCVLGQVFEGQGGYIGGVDFLGIAGDRNLQASLGFEITKHESNYNSVSMIVFDDLRVEWMKVIQELRN